MTIADRGTFGKYWRFLEFWEDKALKQRKTVEEFILPILDNALENRKDDFASGEVKEIKEETFLEHLVKLTEGEPYVIERSSNRQLTLRAALDRKIVMDEILNILLAARDTVSLTVGFLFFAQCHRLPPF
jgi:hypothetical protein